MRKWISLFVLVPSLVFPLAALLIVLRFQALFQVNLLINIPGTVIISFVLVIAAATLFFRSSKLLLDNIPGLVLLFAFTIGYFLLAQIFNHVEINTNNIYFEADSWSWLRRMASEDGWQLGTRAVHPFTSLLFRPLIAALSILSAGDRYQAGLLALSLAGGGCVFLMWKIVRQMTSETDNAILFTSLLGLSASHLIFASVMETYIFSALCLLFFLWLLLNNKSIYLLIITVIVTFGITITNILQQGFSMLLVQKNFRRTIILFSFAILIGIGLNVLSKSIYPATVYVFLPQNIAEEGSFRKEVTSQRAILLAENIFIYNVTAPQPYTKVRDDMPRFNFLDGTIREYIWFGWPSLILWSALLVMAFALFLKNFKLSSPVTQLSLAMLGCLFFNYFLHIGYGVEPFLYSADWTYAIVLFTAINLIPLAAQNWFKFTLFAVLISVLVNNMWFLYLIAMKTGDYLTQ
jgi:hypothetical protein